MKLLRLSLHRGQTLVLFALMLLILVLMVALTLSTGMKVKEKMEVQSVADAAAFSNATATARTYNEVALMQRGQIGQMVAMASTQSLISFAGFYRSQVEATRKAYIAIMVEYGLIVTACCIPKSPCMPMCKCAIKAVKDANKTRKDMVNYQKELKGRWDNPDKLAGLQTYALHGAAATMYRVHQMGRLYNLQNALRNQKLAGEVVKAASNGAKWSGEWSAPSAAGVWGQNLKEISVMEPREMLKHHLAAAMGSRGYTFVTNREGGGTTLSLAINMKIPKPDIAVMTDKGNAWWGPSNNDGKSTSGKFSWADDHGSTTVTFLRAQAPCPPLPGFSNAKKSYVKSTDIDDKSDQHVFDGGKDSEPAHQRHKLGKCTQNSSGTNCPGMWPGFLDYDEDRIENKDDLFGQPKTFAVIQRDYTSRGERADPWNFFFRFRFTPTAVKFANSGLNLTSEGQSLNISKQTALSTGLAYYHRPNRWRETPNFFNPYWRATLVSATIDNPSGSHAKAAFNGAGVPWAADAWQKLKSKGFKGGP